MERRGRVGKAERDLSELSAELVDARPDPPKDLTREQAREWRAVVQSMPPDWFQREHHSILAAYCAHVCRRRFLDKALAVQTLDNAEDVTQYDKLAKAAERETRALLACARSMRFTHQSRYDERTAARNAANVGSEPWLMPDVN
jgi:recombinational DNA repair ATPase RecF